MRRRASEGVDDAASRRSGGFGAREQALLVGAGVLLLVLAAWSVARSELGDPPRRGGAEVPGDSGLRDNLLLVALGAIAMLVALVVLRALRHRRRLGLPRIGELGRPPSWRRVIATLVVGLLLVLALLLGGRREDDPSEPPPQEVPTEETEQAPREGSDGATGWGAAALLGVGALVVLVGAYVIHRRRRWHGEADLDARGAELTPPPEPDDLERLDPRAAVRAAYAAARRRLATIGLAPQDAETPREYLARVRAGHADASRALEVLTRLFELARFSHHHVTDAMKRDAITAYADICTIVHDELAARAAEDDRRLAVSASGADEPGGASS